MPDLTSKWGRENADILGGRTLSHVVKVGPKGYVHGWIYVGPQAAGTRVVHPRHGHGTVHQTEGGRSTVHFDNGKQHTFEAARRPKAPGHFTPRDEHDKPVSEPIGNGSLFSPEETKRLNNVLQDFPPGSRGAARRWGEALRDGDLRASRAAALELSRALTGADPRFMRMVDQAQAEFVSRHGARSLAQSMRRMPHEGFDTVTPAEVRALELHTPEGVHQTPHQVAARLREFRRTGTPPSPHPLNEPSHPGPASTGDRLDAARTAIAEGRHADAVNHLRAAGDAAPDKKTRAAIDTMRRDLTARLMGRKAPNPKQKPARPRAAKGSLPENNRSA